MKKPAFVFMLIYLFLQSCKEECNCPVDPSCRSGAACNDGSTDNSVDTSACTGHGGVDYFLCD